MGGVGASGDGSFGGGGTRLCVCCAATGAIRRSPSVAAQIGFISMEINIPKSVAGNWRGDATSDSVSLFFRRSTEVLRCRGQTRGELRRTDRLQLDWTHPGIWLL